MVSSMKQNCVKNMKRNKLPMYKNNDSFFSDGLFIYIIISIIVIVLTIQMVSSPEKKQEPETTITENKYEINETVKHINDDFPIMIYSKHYDDYKKEWFYNGKWFDKNNILQKATFKEIELVDYYEN